METGKQLGASCPQLASDPKHGSWGFALSYGSEPDPKHPGKTRRRYYRQGGYDTKRQAPTALSKLRASLDAGTFTEVTNKTLGEYALEVFERRRKTGNGLKPATEANYYRYIHQDIRPKLGHLKLTDIRRFHINAWVAEMSMTRGAVTVHRALATLRMILRTAVKDELIAANPALMVDNPKVSDSHVEAWEAESLAEFLQRCGHRRLGPLFELATFTGLRRGEICGLHWSDVDFAKRTIVVKRNRVSVDGKVQESTTKTRSGRRQVPLSDAATAALLTWQLRQTEEAENAAGAWRGDGHVFTMEDGRALDPPYVTRLFNKIHQQGDMLPPLTFHGLRHCFASLALAGGADIAVVSKLLGHASISITSDVYGHLVGTVASDAVNGVAAQF